MEIIIYLIPPSILLGAILIYGFFWSLKNHQYDDLDSQPDRLLHIEERSQKND